MFEIYEPFLPGWNRVTIMEAQIKEVVSYKAISLILANDEGVEKMFYIFFNNNILLKQLVLTTFGPEWLNRKIDEAELVGKQMMVFLQPKASYYVINTIMGCDEDEQFRDFPSNLF